MRNPFDGMKNRKTNKTSREHREEDGTSATRRQTIGAFLEKRGLLILACVCALLVGASAFVSSVWGNGGPDADNGQAVVEATQAPGDGDLSILNPGTGVVQATPGTTGASTDSKNMCWPVDGTVADAFAMDRLVYSETLNQWATHNGIDIQAKEGVPVRAAMAGTVLESGCDALFGYYVSIQHEGGLKTYYASLRDTATVDVGDSVIMGQQIGQVGATASSELKEGSHLHFEVYQNGIRIDPVAKLPEGGLK